MENYKPISALDPANESSEDDLYPTVQGAGTKKQTLRGMRQAIISAWSSPIRSLLGAQSESQIKGSLGLSKIDNTSDAEKPVSTAQRQALDAKASVEDMTKAQQAVDVLGRTRDAVFRKSVFLELPQLFPDYVSAFQSVGSPSQGNIYPQGHCYDEQGRIYIKYANGSRAAIAWYEPNGAYGGWFLIAPGGESLVIIAENGVRRLYNKAGTDGLHAYDISVLPTNGATVAGVSTGLTGVGLQYAYDRGRWIIEQLQVDMGMEGSRTRWQVYDKNFVRCSEFYVAKNIVGWQLPTNAHYNYVPKSQGVVLQGGRVIFGLGGSYIPETDGPVSMPVAAVGVAACGLDGSLLEYGTVRADQLVNRLAAEGHYCVRMESEGLALRPDGTISHLLLTARPSSPGADTGGILLVTEYDPQGASYADISEPYTPFSMDRALTGIFPRGPDGRMYDPFTGAVFATLQQILRYMADLQMPRFTWYSSAVSIAPMGVIEFPASSRVEVFNQNNEAFLVVVWTSAKEFAPYWVNLKVNSTELLGTRSAYLRNGFVANGDVFGRILTPHRDSSQADILVLQQTSTQDANLVIVGGGSTAFTAATRIWFYAALNATSKVGVKVAEIFTNGFNPGEDNGFDLGALLKRWREAFITKLTLFGPMRLGQYTVATLPDPSLTPNYILDADDGYTGIRSYRSTGTAWELINAPDAQLRDRATHTGLQAISTVSGLQGALDGKLASTQRGAANGVAALDAMGKVPVAQMPLDNLTLGGSLGVGAAPVDRFLVNLRGIPTALPAAGSQYGMFSAGTYGVVSFCSAYGGVVNLAAQAAPAVVALTANFTSIAPGLGANVTVTEHDGFRMDSVTSTAVTMACAARLNQTLQSGYERWNVYAAGNAPNYMNGDLRIGTTAQSGSDKLTVSGPARLSGALRIGQYTIATMPDPAIYPGYLIEVTDAPGGTKTCKSHTTAWKILNTDTVVS
ncbi:hypothetical protein PZ739_13140 [Pseudomonas kermanshahensis]|uniref:hypothetical protein n=1 Tax=Pseudomonas kermanshahensis TaxID=2745482 RepID=UPI0023DACD05|nr:hypothetical protein [Pseudomonas kermanshahensis]WEL58057.1 hypothetical protein PZ739_13140 [Pseudomonas kermanshahensis]